MNSKIENTILGYVKWANDNPKTLKANERRPKEVISHTCHTVYTLPVVDGKKMRSLNDTLRDLKADPIDSVNALIKAGKIVGRPIRGGFSISFPKPGTGEKKSHTISNLELLEKLLTTVKPPVVE